VLQRVRSISREEVLMLLCIQEGGEGRRSYLWRERRTGRTEGIVGWRAGVGRTGGERPR